MKIGIIGCSQMGGYYADILTKKLEFSPNDIVAYDIDREKLSAFANAHGVGTMTEPYANVDAAIVATNTPSHANVIEKLAGVAPYILCEKPLGFTPRDVEKIWNFCKDAHVLTALVINFSGVLAHLQNLIERENLFALELYGNWGKPRPLDKNVRPSAGDVEDEATHPIAFALALIRSPIWHVAVSARVGQLPFVDPLVQEHACSVDSSFPKQPNHSTSARLNVRTSPFNVPVEVRSSFLLAKQERQVGGVFGDSSGLPKYAFEANFDKNGADELTLVDLEAKTSVTRTFSVDKLTELTKAFLESVRSGNIDQHLTQFDEASLLVNISDAILRSDRKKGEVIWTRG